MLYAVLSDSIETISTMPDFSSSHPLPTAGQTESIVHTDPYPHIIIDNFLSAEVFNDLKASIKSHNSSFVRRAVSTQLEEKTVHAGSSLDPATLDLLDILSTNNTLQRVSLLSGVNSNFIHSLADIPGYAGYSPYHLTKDKGFLASHVDHSHVLHNGIPYIHIANAIFYLSDRWEEGWGGETLLFSSTGLSIKKSIQPIPNRLILFLHCATSFHGVARYNSSSNVARETIYNDYYIPANLFAQYQDCLKSHCKGLPYTNHCTTSVPIIQFGYRHFWNLPFSRKIHLALASKPSIYLFAYYLLNRLCKVPPGIGIRRHLHASVGALNKLWRRKNQPYQG